MSVQQFWNLSQLLGVFTCRKLANLCQNFVTETFKQRSETTRRRLCCERLGTSHDVKGFAIGSFLECIVESKIMMSSVRKTLKTLVWSAQNRSISCEICLKITTKSAVFLPIAFRPSLPWKFPRNRPIFPRFCPQKSREIWLFFRELSEALFRCLQRIHCFSYFAPNLNAFLMPISTKDSLICFARLRRWEWDWCVSGDLCFTIFFYLLFFLFNLLILFLYFFLYPWHSPKKIFNS